MCENPNGIKTNEKCLSNWRRMRIRGMFKTGSNTPAFQLIFNRILELKQISIKQKNALRKQKWHYKPTKLSIDKLFIVIVQTLNKQLKRQALKGIQCKQLYTNHSYSNLCQEYNIQLQLSFVDFQKAYNTIELWAINDARTQSK